MSQKFVVALGDRRFEVDRPWGALPATAGKVTDVAINAQGDVFVLTRRDPYVDAVRDCVHVFSRDGDHLRSWGGARITDAHKIACDPQGRVWVADRDSHEVVAFDANGCELLALGRRHVPFAPFNHATDIAFSTDGRIWVSDGYAGHRIHSFEPDGRPAACWGSFGEEPGAFLNPHGLWVTGDGRILVADRENNRVQSFDENGRLLAVWNGFHRPSDIWGDAQGNFYISDAIPTLTMMANDGTRIGRSRPVLNGAHGLSGDADGTLYLAEGNPSRITRLVPQP